VHLDLWYDVSLTKLGNLHAYRIYEFVEVGFVVYEMELMARIDHLDFSSSLSRKRKKEEKGC